MDKINYSTALHNNHSFIKNVSIVLISNISSLITSVLISFFIPKILGVSEYGYYNTFVLYSSYIGILHFGFIDGIYLKYAGNKFEDLNKEKFRAYTRFLFIMESAITILLLGFSFAFLNTAYFLIIIFLAFNIIATNIGSYFEFISQITMKFKTVSIRNILRCILNVLSVLVLFMLFKYRESIISGYIYIAITLLINYALATWYFLSYRCLIFGKGEKIKDIKQDIFDFFKVGIPLLLSNLVGRFIYVVDQQFVNVAFDNDTYSLYAFAYNLITLITIATTAISTVLYPTLKTINEETIKKNYSKINSYLLMFVGISLITYFPLCLIVEHFLPNYITSLKTFFIILPGVLISSSISVIKYNCYKTFNKVNNYFIKSIIVLALAIVADLIVYYIFKDTKSISIVSIFVLFIWYLMVELFFVKNYQVKWIKNLLYMISIITCFYTISFVPNIYLEMGIYFLVFTIITLSFNFKELKELFQKKEEVVELDESL